MGSVPKGNLLVTVTETGEQTKNGVIIPDFEKKHKEAIVEIGGEEVKKGDRIMLDADGVKLNIDDKEYLLIRERDVLYFW